MFRWDEVLSKESAAGRIVAAEVMSGGGYLSTRKGVIEKLDLKGRACLIEGHFVSFSSLLRLTTEDGTTLENPIVIKHYRDVVAEREARHRQLKFIKEGAYIPVVGQYVRFIAEMAATVNGES